MSGDEETWKEFREAVNMTPGELEEWLETEQSKSVGQKSGDGESTGHASGRRIVGVARTQKDDLEQADYEHMRKVVGYFTGTSHSDRPVTSGTRTGATR
ncbi:DUF3140 domain-containing protein [Rhodococcus tibetensis]|uniref:DUF3140 domain-containing protein n=1 Tax=Rhodococcus tibetensis TaxID=2965064 RepID=A0ABT1QKL4_9NOCA|nr:DUF3140 domain-containing protein [Rhodococcus sp. FXJ9.536]MCQ4122752.1 DUF3140 domain-containing protein [Rhodococcus sp. FXJ9.536]